MSLRERLGFDPFRRKVLLPTLDTERVISAVHDQYGAFCEGLNPRFAAEWRSRGLDDFPLLCQLEGVSHVGVNLEDRTLHVLTTSIDAFDDHDILREIGEIIVTFDAVHQVVRYENVTHPRCVKSASAVFNTDIVYEHPHIMDGKLCCTGNDAILQSFKDAEASVAMERIIRNLRMRAHEVDAASAYLDVENWPRKRTTRGEG